MAARYVYSGAGGAATGADWANAHLTLAAAITAGAAGDDYYVAHDHAESTAGSLTLTFKGTGASPDRIVCVNRAGSVPPVAADLATTATVSTTGLSSLNIAGTLYCYGIYFTSGSGANANSLVAPSATSQQTYEKCVFKLGGTSGGTLQIGNSPSQALRVEWIDCQVYWSNVTHGLLFTGAGRFVWRNDPALSPFATGSTASDRLFSSTTLYGHCVFSGLDLSSMGASKTIVRGGTTQGLIQLVNCRLNASVTVADTLATVGNTPIELIGSGSTTNVARNEKYGYTATLTTETTITRTSGASDGVTAYSWKIVSNANNERQAPLETFEGAVWNTATGSAKTLTVHTVTDGVTLTDAECWLEIDYLGSSATPVSTRASDGAATILTTAANQATSTEAWTTTGLASPVYQKLEVTFTPNMVGPVRWRVKYGKASSTVYVCPKAELS